MQKISPSVLKPTFNNKAVVFLETLNLIDVTPIINEKSQPENKKRTILCTAAGLPVKKRSRSTTLSA